jgi:tetratricopeptide (TPR) repeat protein
MRKHFLTLFAVLLTAATLAPRVSAQGALAGKILDEETEAPIVGALVVFENPSANPARIEQTTDEEGGFTVLGMDSGTWSISPTAEGYEPRPGTISIRQVRNPAVEIFLTRLKHPLEIAFGSEAFEGLDPAAIGDELAVADAAYDNKQWDTALSGYDAVLAKLPVYTDLELKRGNTLQEMERYEDAIAAFEAGATANPQLRSQVDPAIARLRMQMGDFEGAEALLSSGAGGSREDLYNLGEVEFAKGDVDAAAGWYEKAAALDPSWAKPFFKLALVQLNKGDMEGAKAFFAQVVEKDPSSEEGTQAQATLDALP